LKIKDLKVCDRLIISLDVSSKKEVINLCKKINNSVTTLKLGLELIYSNGLSIIDTVKSFGYKVMLDAKLMDIPNTISNAVAAITKLGVDKITIHTLGGERMLKDAKSRLREECYKINIAAPMLFAVTILTSLDSGDLINLGFKADPLHSVLNLAKIAVESGIDGIICSPDEVKSVRERLGYNFYIATPGIRLSEDLKSDQKRFSTPSSAIKDGADYIVVGRSITLKENITDTVNNILYEIERSLKKDGSNKSN
jgi:orotidine-5'-phosphate decarboxylase